MIAKQLSAQEKLERAFIEDEFEFAEDIHNMDTYQHAKIKTLPVGGELGAMTFGETLELHADGDIEASVRRAGEEDTLLEEFYHE